MDIRRKRRGLTLPILFISAVIAATAVAAEPPPPTSFLISGEVYDNTGEPANNPNVAIRNENTGEVFIGETNEGSNYYPVSLSSDNVSAGGVLHFNASNDNVTEFDHAVTVDEINNGGFVQQIAILHPPAPMPDLLVTAINAYHNNTDCPAWFNLSNEIDVTVKNAGNAPANESEGGGRRTEISGTAGVIRGPAGDECTMQDGTFTCEGPEETFNKPLFVGWNLISLPLTATDMKVANIIDASLSGSYDALHKYDISTHSFVPLSSTDTMANGAGYFINITAPDTWTYSGSAYTTMNEGLSEGLNMVGWLNCSKDIVNDNALSSLAGSYYYAARWNATSQRYETYNPVAPGEFNDFTMMERGEGYFISAEAGCPALTKNC